MKVGLIRMESLLIKVLVMSELKIYPVQVSMQGLVNSIREEVSCCCSLFRYNTINELLDDMQDILDKEQSNLVEEDHF